MKMKNSIKLIVLIQFLTLIGSLNSVSLPKFNVDAKETSVSGLSSGAFFANQVQIALSSIIKGAGIVAGGPYDCGGQHSFMLCMYASSPSISTSISQTKEWSGSHIDDISHLKHQKVYMISGSADNTVGTSVMNQLYKYLVTDSGFIPASNVVYKHDLPSGHTFPTDFDGEGNNACSSSSSPYISNCNFDGAGAILQHIYGGLKARRAAGQTTGHLIEFSQSEFVSMPSLYGLDSKGFAYVPKACSDGEKCRLHIAFHGCLQSYSNIGNKFVKNTGFDRWADTNNIIVVFPQTTSDFSIHLTPSNFYLNNLNACWDWIGWYGSDFATKSGKQIQFIKNIINRIAE